MCLCHDAWVCSLFVCLCEFVFVRAVWKDPQECINASHTHFNHLITHSPYLSHFILGDHRPCARFVVVFLCRHVHNTHKHTYDACVCVCVYSCAMWASPHNARFFSCCPFPLDRNLNTHGHVHKHTRTQELWFDLLSPDEYPWDLLVCVKAMLEYCGWRRSSNICNRAWDCANWDGLLVLEVFLTAVNSQHRNTWSSWVI